MANVLYRRDGGRCFFFSTWKPHQLSFIHRDGCNASKGIGKIWFLQMIMRTWVVGIGAAECQYWAKKGAGQLHFTAVCLCTPSNFKTTGSLGSRIFLKKPVDQIQENLFVIALGTCRHVAYKSAQVCMHKIKDFFVGKNINNADTYTYPKFVECFLISVSHSLFSLWTWQALSHPLGASRFFCDLEAQDKLAEVLDTVMARWLSMSFPETQPFHHTSQADPQWHDRKQLEKPRKEDGVLVTEEWKRGKQRDWLTVLIPSPVHFASEKGITIKIQHGILGAGAA